MYKLKISHKNRKETYESGYKKYATADYSNQEIYQFYRQYFSKQNQVERYNYNNNTFYDVESYEKEFGKIMFLTYQEFNAVTSRYNKHLAEKIINGESNQLGFSIGKIDVCEVFWNRALRKDGTINKKISWPETIKLNQFKPDGTRVVVYHTEKSSYRIAWHNGNCNILNSYVYKFQPSSILIRALFKKLKEEPLIELKYKQNTVIKPFK